MRNLASKRHRVKPVLLHCLAASHSFSSNAEDCSLELQSLQLSETRGFLDLMLLALSPILVLQHLTCLCRVLAEVTEAPA